MVTFVSTILAVSAVWIISAAWKFLNCVWFKPKKIEKLLRDQGINGTSYKWLDVVNFSTAEAQVESKPMEHSHRILPRAMNFDHQIVTKYGKVSFYWIGRVPTLIILDSDMMREALGDKSGYFPPEEFHPLIKLLDNGIFSYVGEKWVKHKRIISPAFHQERLRLLLPAFDTCCRQMVAKWQKSALANGSFELDVQPEILNLIVDVISRTIFADNYEVGRRVHQLQVEQAALLMEVLPMLYIPGIQYLPTKRIKRMKEIHREIRNLVTDVIKKREQAMKTGETYGNDILSVLMESNLKEISSNANSKKAGMTTDEIIEECKMFYNAGHETVSVMLTWTMIVLSMHPDWQEKARREVLQIFGRNPPHFDGLNQLKIVGMILNEILRLYTPISSMIRYTPEKVKLGDVILPAGIQVAIPLLLVHHDRDIWGEDVDEFNPERFSKGVPRLKNNENSFFAFGLGPRSCMGRTFAFLEAKMAMAIILQHFSFELSSEYVHAPLVNGMSVLYPEHGAKLILHKI